jgi:hypothetical protein
MDPDLGAVGHLLDTDDDMHPAILSTIAPLGAC